MTRQLMICCAVVWMFAGAARGADLVPPIEKIQKDRPRLLLRPKATPWAVTVEQIKAGSQDAEFQRMLDALKKDQRHAASAALGYLLTGDRAMADRAVAIMRGFKAEKAGPFEVYFNCRDFALAYDWLYGYEGFGAEAKAALRKAMAPLVQSGLKISDDHLFHNYVWQSAGGLALWALATAGDGPESDRLFEEIRGRLNQRLFPGMGYLNGAPGELLFPPIAA